MNTVGKILVILNFLFAIVVGGLLVMDFATRTQWRAAYKNLETEFNVLKARAETGTELVGREANRLKQKDMELQTTLQKLKDAEDTAKAEKILAEQKDAELQTKLKDADLTVTKLTGETERLKTEVKDREKAIEAREKAINNLEGDVKKFRQEAIANENLARTVQARAEQLVRQLQETTARLHKMEAGGAGGGGTETVARNAKDPNPPSPRVRGKIEQVNSEHGTVVLSVGSDHGLKQGHTMEAYRLRPEPKYLGMLRIVDVNPHQAVGRLVADGPVALRPQLRAGDLVASELK